MPEAATASRPGPFAPFGRSLVERPLSSESQLHGPRGDPRTARSRPGLRHARSTVAGDRWLGGVGKTQTAVEYAYRQRDQYRAVLWVRAETETSLASGYRELAEVLDLPEGYRELAEVLDLPERDESDNNKVVTAVLRWLGREPGYLLILDNADNPALVKDYLPPTPTGHVLLTSRAHNFNVLGIRRPIALPVLEPDEALEFLVKRTDREGPLDPAERDAARILAEALGYLPLAVEQTAAYMVEHDEPFSVYLDAYRTLRLKLLEEMGPVTGAYLRDRPHDLEAQLRRRRRGIARVHRAASASAPSSPPTPSRTS